MNADQGTTIVAIEKGERRLTADELIRIAEYLGRSVSDFVAVHAHTAPLAPQFRSGLPASRPGAPPAEHDLLQAVDELELLSNEYVELECLCKMPMPRDYPPAYRFSDSQGQAVELGEVIALEERNRLGLGESPISDLRALLEEVVGLRIFYYAMPSVVAGLFAYNDTVGGCIADLLHVAQFYGVSVQAMCLRLEELRRLPAGTWDRLKKRGLKPEKARQALGLPAATNNRQKMPQRFDMATPLVET